MNKNRIIKHKRLALLKAKLSLAKSIISISTNKEFTPMAKLMFIFQTRASYDAQVNMIRHTLPDNTDVLDVTMMGSTYSYTLPQK